MAITVKHKFVSAIPDAGDPTIVQPSNWNDDHELTGIIPVDNGGTGASTLTGYVKGNGTSAMTAATTIPNTDITGLGTMATQNANNVAITGGTMSGVAITGYIPTTEKGAALGVATLDAGGQVPVSQLPPMGDLNYQGTWNATTNTPTLTSSVGTKGYYYVVSVAGTTDLNGITDWQIGDWAVFNGSIWQKIDNTDAVTSVNGFTGTVVLTTTNIAEGTNEYFTTARARNSVSAGTGISYNSTTGVITNSSPSLGGDVVGPASSTDMGIARFDGTTGKLLQNSNALIDDNDNIINPRSVQFSGALPLSPSIGSLWFDAATDTLNLQQNAITQQIGEEIFVYGKASAAITDSPLQIIYHTGSVGASGVVTFGPTIAGITDENAIIGVATESIPLNGFGRITSFGVVHGITTDGSAFGETWADDDVIWYNPVTGNPTKVKPVAPNIKFQIGTVINAGSGGSGSFQVNLVQGTALGGTDSNVQLGTLSAANLLTYSTTSGYWKNTALAAGTGISVGNAASGVVTVTNSAPDQTVAIASGTGISVTGTYPNFTVTNTAPSSGGTVTSVSGTAGRITSTGGTTPVIDLASGIATAGTTGSSTLIPVVTIDTYGRVTGITTAANPQGTVTSVTGTAPVVSSGGATPAISMAAATGSVNGYLTSTDWTTFNSKAPAVTYTTNYVPFGQGTTTPNLSSSFTYVTGTGTLTAPVVSASNGLVVNSNTVSASYSIPSGSSASSVGPVTVASGQAVTIPSGSRWVVL